MRCQLNDARSAGRSDAACARIVKVDVGCKVEVDLVEDVEEFRAEFHVHSLVQPSAFDQAEIGL